MCQRVGQLAGSGKRSAQACLEKITVSSTVMSKTPPPPPMIRNSLITCW